MFSKLIALYRKHSEGLNLTAIMGVILLAVIAALWFKQAVYQHFEQEAQDEQRAKGEAGQEQIRKNLADWERRFGPESKQKLAGH
jgi:uncharacterized protein YpmB